MEKFKATLLLLSLAFIFASCSTEEGVGGKNIIKGQVVWQDIYDRSIQGKSDTIVAEYPAFDQKVFIVYGSDNVASDDTDTNDEGYFEFRWLKKGSYRVYALENCYGNDCGDKEKISIGHNVEISSRKGTSTTPIIYLKNYLN